MINFLESVSRMTVIFYNIFYHEIVLIFYFILATIHHHYHVFQSAGFIVLNLQFLKNYKINFLVLAKLGEKNPSFSKRRDVLYKEEFISTPQHYI